MRREDFDKLVDETTDLIMEKLSEGFYANPGTEEGRKRQVVRAAVRDGFLNLVFSQMQQPGLPSEEEGEL
jgi:hypothetical protein